MPYLNNDNMKKTLHPLNVFLALFLLALAPNAFASECGTNISTGQGSITIDGLKEPINIVKIFNQQWENIYECYAECENNIVLDQLSTGPYYIKINTYTSDWDPICSSDALSVTVMGNSGEGSTTSGYCTNVGVAGGAGAIGITGVDAPWHRIRYRPAMESEYIEFCNDDCGNPAMIPNLIAGSYFVKVDQSDIGGGSNYCIVEFAVDVREGTIDFCSNISVTGGTEMITITGTTAPWQRISYKGAGSTTYVEACNDNCTSNQIITGLPAGTYTVRIDQNNNNNQPYNYCTSEFEVTVISIAEEANGSQENNGQGTEDLPNLCAGVTATGGDGTIIVFGANAPWQQLSYRLTNSPTFIEVCNDNCNDPHTISGLAPGNYTIKLNQNNNNNQVYNYCSTELNVTVTGTSTVNNSNITSGMEYSGPISTANACAIRTATNTTSCDFGDYGLYLNTYTEGLNFFYRISEGQFIEYDDGTARFVGTMTNTNNAEAILKVDVTFRGRTTTGGQFSPKEHTCGGQQDLSTFYYYTSFSGSLTGEGLLNGALLTIQNDGPDFQLGNGANIKEGRNPQPFGGGGWFTVTVESQANGLILNFPEGVAAQVGDINISLSGSASECMEVTTVNVCAVRTATNTTSCDFGDYGLYLNTYTEGLNFFYRISEGQFTEYDDGTARFVGTMTNTNNPEAILKVDVAFQGRTTTGSPKEHTCGGVQDLSTFYYYTSFSGSLTGEGQLNGALLTIQNDGPDFQLGSGANITEGSNPQPFGGSGWFTVTVQSQANGLILNFPEGAAAQVGDINISLSGSATACMEGTSSAPVADFMDQISTENACAVREATNTNSCDFGEYGVYLNTYAPELNFFYDIIEGQLVEYSDGTARFVATMVNKNDLWMRFQIDVTFKGRTNIAGPESPKEHTCGAEQNLNSFYYYSSFSGTITGTEAAEGALLNITNNGAAFQLGNGANVTERIVPQPFGGSGWFTVEVVSEPNNFTFNFPEGAAAHVGDINFTLSGNASACMGSQVVEEIAATSRQSPFTTLNAFSYNRQIDLEGITNQVTESDYFVIEKSVDGQHFEAIDKINNNELDAETTYFKTVDNQPTPGVNYYRINQFYKNGRSSYTEVKKVDFNIDVSSFSVFPNPARSEIFINLSPFAGQEGQVIVTNHLGYVIKELQFSEVPNEPIRIDFKEFNNGLYIIRSRVGKAQWMMNKVMVSKLY